MNIKPLALSVLCGVCLVAPSTAETADTVRAYDRTSVRAYYDGRGLVRQVQRFVLPAGTTISSIGLMVRGEPCKVAGNIVIYGHEGGLVAPRLGKELYRTTFAKHNFGNEEVRVPLDPVFTHAGGQFFVSFEGLADGIDVLTDTRRRTAPCREAWGEERYDQMQLDKEGKWKQTPLAYCVELAVKVPTSTIGQFVRDTTFDDVADKQKEATKYLSVTDLDMNGYVDVASAGVLQLRDEQGGVVIDMQRNEHAPYVFFADVDGDHRPEVLSMETSNASRIDVLRLGADRHFKTAQSITLPQRFSVGSMSIGDINDDGLADVILTGQAESTASMMALVSSASGSRAEAITVPDAVILHRNATLLCADMHASAGAEIVLRTPNHDYILRYSGTGTAALLAEREHTGIGSAVGSAGIVLGGDDGSVQLVLPSQRPWSVTPASTQPRLNLSGEEHVPIMDGDAVRYEERISAEHRADLDNDGIDEIIRFAGGTCRRMGVFKRAHDAWTDVSGAFGLDSLDDCDDGVLADMNKDGRLDLVVVRRQRLEVYMNRMSIPEATTMALHEYPASTAVLSASGAVLQSTFMPSGFGHLFQAPAQAHVVRNTNTQSGTPISADSVVVRWTGSAGGVESYALHAGSGNASTPTAGHWQVAERSAGHGTSATTALTGEAAQTVGMKQEASDVVINTTQALSSAALSVYDIAGNRIGETSLGSLPQGAHRIALATLMNNSSIASGTYRAVLTSKTLTTTCPIVLVR